MQTAEMLKDLRLLLGLLFRASATTSTTTYNLNNTTAGLHLTTAADLYPNTTADLYPNTTASM